MKLSVIALSVSVLTLVLTEILRSYVNDIRLKRDGLGGTGDIGMIGVLISIVSLIAALILLISGM